MNDILLDDQNDLLAEDDDLKLGDAWEQEASAIVQSTQGNFKNDPLLGANLLELSKAKGGESAIRSRVSAALARDGKRADIRFVNNQLEITRK